MTKPNAGSPFDPEEHLPLIPEDFHVLLALESGERHGYSIIKEVERATDGRVCMAASPFYRKLKRLEAWGWVEESDERPTPELDDERRRYYALTKHGRMVLRAEARRMVELVGSQPVLRLLRRERRRRST
jgi:DNA-binding PadR family transcriptional regulator